MLFKLVHMVCQVTARQEAPMHHRVQRLDAPVKDLREAGQFADALDLNPGLTKDLFGAAGAVDFDAEFGQSGREVRQSGLVRDTDNGAHMVLQNSFRGRWSV